MEIFEMVPGPRTGQRKTSDRFSARKPVSGSDFLLLSALYYNLLAGDGARSRGCCQYTKAMALREAKPSMLVVDVTRV